MAHAKLFQYPSESDYPLLNHLFARWLRFQSCQNPHPFFPGEKCSVKAKALQTWVTGGKKGNKWLIVVMFWYGKDKNKMDEGKRMIEDGENVMRESEENYKNIKK
jgi:hypothetical protein